MPGRLHIACQVAIPLASEKKKKPAAAGLKPSTIRRGMESMTEGCFNHAWHGDGHCYGSLPFDWLVTALPTGWAFVYSWAFWAE